MPADLFAPCALGGIVNPENLDKLMASGDLKIIAGAANNVLDHDSTGDLLRDKGVLYAPDYVINAGGLINVANELEGYNRERAVQQAASIYNVLTQVYQIARDEKITTLKAANALAERRIQRLGRIKGTYTGVQIQKRARGII